MSINNIKLIIDNLVKLENIQSWPELSISSLADEIEFDMIDSGNFNILLQPELKILQLIIVITREEQIITGEAFSVMWQVDLQLLRGFNQQYGNSWLHRGGESLWYTLQRGFDVLGIPDDNFHNRILLKNLRLCLWLVLSAGCTSKEVIEDLIKKVSNDKKS